MGALSHDPHELALIGSISRMRLLDGAGLGRVLRSRAQGQTLTQALLGAGRLPAADLQRAAATASLRWVRCGCGWEALQPLDAGGGCRNCSGNTLPAELQEPGEPLPAQIGAFEILGLIGQGGMGKVLRARDPVLDRQIALKVLASGEGGLRRFEREGRVIAALNHPYIVKVHGFGLAGRQPYLAMDYIEGIDLERRLERDGALTADDAAALVAKVAGAVAHAHERGVIHRDLKPANILIDERGDPRVVDFGLALPVAEARITGAHRTLGTPAYMAPEQIKTGCRVDHRVDIYALGVVLYRCLSGGPLFQADDIPELYRLILSVAPPPLSGHPPELAGIVSKAMGKQPGMRYQQAEALARDLNAFLRGEEVSVRPLGPLARIWRGYRANRQVANLMLALLVSLVGLLAYGLYSQSRRAGLAARYRVERDRAQHALSQERAMRAERDATLRVSHADRLLQIANDLERASGSGARVLELLDEARRLAPDRPLALRLRGLLALKQKRWEVAHALLLRARRGQPRDYLTHFFLYRWYEAQGRSNDPAAVEHIARVATYGGDSAFGWWGKACVAWGEARAAVGAQRDVHARQAIEYCNRSLALRARFHWSLVIRADCYRMTRQYRRALADHGSLIEIAGGTGGHNDRATIYLALGMTAEALADYGRAIRHAPDQSMGYINRGRTYRELRRFREALADYDKAVSIADEHLAEAYNGRGLLHVDLGQYEPALADYARAIARAPRRATSYTNRGILYARQGRPEPALADFTRAIQLRSNWAPAYYNRALLHVAHGKPGLGLRDFSRAIRLDPEHAGAFGGRAALLRKAQRFEAALRDADARVRLCPQDAMARVSRARIYQDLQRTDEALRAYAKALELAPGHDLALIHRGLLLMKLERHKEALSDLQAGMTRTRDPAFREKLGGLVQKLRVLVGRSR